MRKRFSFGYRKSATIPVGGDNEENESSCNTIKDFHSQDANLPPTKDEEWGGQICGWSVKAW